MTNKTPPIPQEPNDWIANLPDSPLHPRPHLDPNEREELIEVIAHYVFPAVGDGVAIALRGIEKYGDADAMMEDGTDYDEWFDDMVDKNTAELADFILAHQKIAVNKALADFRLDLDVQLALKKPDPKWGKNRSHGFTEGLGYARAKILKALDTALDNNGKDRNEWLVAENS